MFEWKDEYSVGVKEIDEQHRKLFEIGGRASSLVKNTLISNKYDKILDVISELIDYTFYHFKCEENLMLQAKYRGFFSHKLEHEDFINKVNRIDFKSVDENQSNLIVDILELVLVWIEQHIMEKDKLLIQLN
jgi:hemerythrin